jgi:NAD+ synthase (glutamine-hydrolysing)
VRVALAQLNTVVGDIDGNAGRLAAALAAAADAGADLTLAPELAITGYPPEDLLLRPAFAAEARRALDRVAAGVRSGVAIVGFP